MFKKKEKKKKKIATESVVAIRCWHHNLRTIYKLERVQVFYTLRCVQRNESRRDVGKFPFGCKRSA